MGRFQQEFKDYEQYDDGDCYKKTVPTGMTDALAEVLATSCGVDGEATTATTMRSVANDLLSMAGRKPTSNWEAGALKTEIKSAYHILQESRFDKFMDATLNAAQRLYKAYPAAREGFLRDINDVLIAANFGYALRAVDAADRLLWELRTAALAGVSSLIAGAEAVKDISTEALEHLQQAVEHLYSPSRPRSRKDAVRDAMSALEAMVKKLASEADFDRASKKLRDEKIWGNDQIVKEGHSTWGLLHHHYPDIRHGQQTGSDLDLEEALYWIGRITTYVKYMAARKRVLGR